MLLARKSMLVAGALLALAVAAPPAAVAKVSVSRAELNGTKLRIEGRAIASRTITVDGVAMGASDRTGAFRVESGSFAAPADCTVDLDDGSAAPVTATLSGCTVSTPPPQTTVSLSGLRLSDNDVVGGTSVTGTVVLTAATSGDVVVALSSDNTAAATVPPSVTVPAGSASADFPVTTSAVTNDQSSTLIAELDGVRVGATITVRTQFSSANGSVSLARGGNGEGRVTSEPPGIDCTFTATGTFGTCGNAFFAAGTEVKLNATAAPGSRFRGWEFEVSCRNAPSVVVQAAVAHICRPVFQRR